MTIRSSTRWLVATLAVIALVLGWAGDRWSRGQAADAADTTAQAVAGNHASLLSSELQKFRLLPLVLIEYPDVTAALTGDAAARARLDATLELLAGRTSAANIYAIDASGRTVAANNWRLPTSFVGQNYAFRPYFRDAMRQGASELFALGTVSGRPGLYLARRVERGGRAVGVVVVKVEFDAVEAAWARASGASFVVDRHGVILVTSLPQWRFRTVGSVDPAALADARRSLQFGPSPPMPAPLTIDGVRATATIGAAPARFRLATTPAPIAGGRLIHIAPLDPPLAAARLVALLWALAGLLVAGVAAGLWLRASDTRRLQREARERLEGEVAHRTSELRDANARLMVESDERAEADRRYRAAREDLAQANRLGTLGQITAGVAHEINQPVAAIRAFAESGATLLDRGDRQETRANLQRIVGLADRIGTITAELRGFSRRRTPAGGTTDFGSVLDGALMLVGERARGIVTIDAPPALRATRLVGDRVRIEQILVNLLQNALDAVAGQADAQVKLSASTDEMLHVTIADTGPGIAPDIADQLFTPFTSGKPEGLGLGLAIAREIAREFGGELIHTDASPGATLALTLRIAG